ncbi:MAG: 4-hydroxy-tetrahydrodipicolinate reductase [Coriobacteriia bacterium]|jgi:4-hydroxy-tetrahydrodipicolinate reductase|nr:4-hydroxy-tetrahydrodipicolinate reductase [Coriobacteriia bacterium]
MIDVLVNGAAGRMGREVVAAVTAAEGMRVVAAVDPQLRSGAPQAALLEGVPCFGDLSRAIEQTGPAVMVDFTHPTVVESNLRIALDAGVHCVVGTTGVSESALVSLAAKAPAGVCLFMAPNFAIGAVLMMRFATVAARFMPHVEIIELHHDRKADAPSGTALRTAALVACARAETPESPGEETEIVAGARGGNVDDIRVHSVRLPGLVAHQEVIFGGQGQTLTLRHDSIDRTSFMPGVILAIRGVVSRSGLIIGLENIVEASA